MSKVEEKLEVSAQCLSKDGVLKRIAEKYRAGLSELIVLETTPSTNDFLMAYQKNLHDCCVVCVSHRQTSGKGRSGRVWQSPAGASVSLSMGRYFSSDVLHRVTQLSLFCGVALAEWLQSKGLSAQLKWPNDLLIGGNKLAGILIETRLKADQLYVVIGLGLNVKIDDAAMRHVDQPWTDLSRCLVEEKVYADRNQLVAELIEVLMRSCDLFAENNNVWFKEKWQQYDILSGRDVEVFSEAGVRPATVLGLADDCALLIDVAGQVQSVYAADVKLKIKAC